MIDQAFLYHGTSSLFEEDILLFGVSDPSCWGSITVAEGFAKQACRDNGGTPIIIRKNAHDFSEEAFSPDENMIDFPIFDDFADRAELWRLSKQDWEASLSIYECVVYNSLVDVEPNEIDHF